MKRFIKISFLVALVMALFTGCRTAPVMSYDTPIEDNNAKTSLVKIEKAIISAGTVLGWQMDRVKNGEIIGTLSLRKHIAQVKITYTEKSYQINYLSSSELNYDAQTQTIHSNYNGWVKNLNNGILKNLGMF